MCSLFLCISHLLAPHSQISHGLLSGCSCTQDSCFTFQLGRARAAAWWESRGFVGGSRLCLPLGLCLPGHHILLI